MQKHPLFIAFIVVLTISPFIISYSTVIDSYGYSVLIETTAISTNGFIDFENFALGDHWRGCAYNMLADIRPLTSILVAVLGEVTLLDPIILASLPLFFILLPLVFFLLIANYLRIDFSSPTHYALLFFFLAATTLLQPNGIHYLSFGLFLTVLSTYFAIKWIEHGSSKDAIFTLILFFAASRTYYTAYVSSALFLLGAILFAVFLSRKKRNYWYFAIISVSFMLVLLWFDNILQSSVRTFALENIKMALDNILMFRGDSASYINPYVHLTPPNSIMSIANSITRISIGIMGITSLIMIIKNTNYRRFMPIVSGLLLMGFSETLMYSLIGSTFLVRLLFAFSFPLIIIIWARGFIAKHICNRKILAIIIIIFCILSFVIISRNFGDLTDRQNINKNVQLIDEMMTDMNPLLSGSASYLLVAPATESALLSYRTFRPASDALASFSPLLPLTKGDINAVLSEIKNQRQDEKLVFIPNQVKYMEIYSWGDVYEVKPELYEVFNSQNNVVFNGPFIVYEVR